MASVLKSFIRKRQENFLFDPPVSINGIMNRNDIIDWIWHKRIPFFFKSQMYAEYKVNDALVL